MSTETLVRNDLVDLLEPEPEHVCCGLCYPPGTVDYYISYCGEILDGDDPWTEVNEDMDVCKECLEAGECRQCGKTVL